MCSVLWTQLAIVGTAGGLVLAEASSAQDGLLQYGAIGAIALLALYAVKIMFTRQVQNHDRERAELTARCDRAETQLAQINQLLRDQLVAQLTRATDVIGRVAEQMGEQRHAEEAKGK
jgi:hypothetical protein